jgi:hypothetical protein
MASPGSEATPDGKADFFGCNMYATKGIAQLGTWAHCPAGRASLDSSAKAGEIRKVWLCPKVEYPTVAQ